LCTIRTCKSFPFLEKALAPAYIYDVKENIVSEPTVTQITIDEVRRVASRIANGLPEDCACAKEGVDPDTFRAAREANAIVDRIINAERADFIINAVRIILDSPRGHRGYEYILERRYRDVFSRTGPAAAADAPTGGALSADDHALAQELAQRHLTGRDEGEYQDFDHEPDRN
jgi:hypothetical protein